MQEEREENGPAAEREEDPVTADSVQERVEEERVVEPENALPEAILEGLTEPMRAACARAGWKKLLPVQARAIPYLLAKRNLMVQSQTGSGKTGAFILDTIFRDKSPYQFGPDGPLPAGNGVPKCVWVSEKDPGRDAR